MSQVHTGGRASGAVHHQHSNATARRAAQWLGLAATPTFAIIALLVGMSGSDAADLICSAAHGASPLGGMAPMYLLMAIFHSTPWLKLVSRRRNGSRHPADMSSMPPSRGRIR